MENIIITGSSNGFGLKAAKDFADKAYRVLLQCVIQAEKMQVQKQN
jgi:NAD(P)-dependent dehydrogenase (short-subunit alcohol dehydrogenase family)